MRRAPILEFQDINWLLIQNGRGLVEGVHSHRYSAGEDRAPRRCAMLSDIAVMVESQFGIGYTGHAKEF